ncbi:PIN domain-containing protein [Streptomyces sp. A3M-1-3]|uniref:type II toxin-antitoxin system VapC family toxin n=1 Tax=Streptomyces sp. A3M-1-3 TaxID=2962044 RepID=UPI0020B90283|nr:PIN domain-containing protein [Streptomyces sp. A3M-1-3]MCP3820569.1 PIN domain-containing protein [Streptomyces sp. A3M-1-3]
MTTTVFDTGPIVAALDRRDNRHVECAQFLSTATGRRLLPSPVMTEVCWIFEDWPHIEASFLDLVARGRFELVHPTTEDIERMSELVRQYADFPLGAVDASVISIAERFGVDRIATLDHRHFRAIKPKHVPALTLLP